MQIHPDIIAVLEARGLTADQIQTVADSIIDRVGTTNEVIAAQKAEKIKHLQEAVLPGLQREELEALDAAGNAYDIIYKITVDEPVSVPVPEPEPQPEAGE